MKTANGSKVRQIVKLFDGLNRPERRELLTTLNSYSKFWEDVEDMLAIRQRADEPRIPYQKIRARLQREGQL